MCKSNGLVHNHRNPAVDIVVVQIDLVTVVVDTATDRRCTRAEAKGIGILLLEVGLLIAGHILVVAVAAAAAVARRVVGMAEGMQMVSEEREAGREMPETADTAVEEKMQAVT